MERRKKGKFEVKAAPRRMANFELLRLAAMLMVAVLHYLSKGNILPDFTEAVTMNGYLSCFLESLCIVAVNAFVLLTGYFCVNGEFKAGRLLSLIFQVLFYTLLIPAVLIFAGVIKAADYGIYRVINDVFPVQMEHYWFITSYVLLYCCIPFLNAALKNMSKLQLKAVIVMLLILFALPKTLLPFEVTIDNKGYDFVWFLCLYLLAAYIRLYGLSFFSGRRRSVAVYFLSAAVIFIYTVGMGLLFRLTGKGQELIMRAFQYNHLLNLAASVSFFYVFVNTDIKSIRLQRLICGISPYALGVYLLHEQLDVRYLWPVWFKVEEYGRTWLFIPHLLATAFTIFAAGLIADYLRSLIFNGIQFIYRKMVKNDIIIIKLKNLDLALNGCSRKNGKG